MLFFVFQVQSKTEYSLIELETDLLFIIVISNINIINYYNKQGRNREITNK